MPQQNYNNHIRYYAPHHFIFLPLLAILFGGGIWKIVADEPLRLLWSLFTIIIFCISYLTLMVRQHYALSNQNRIVRLEFQLRYFELYGQRSQHIADLLGFDQIAALRFANDDEFKTLLQKSLDEQWSGKQIKKSIKTWRADNWRV